MNENEHRTLMRASWEALYVPFEGRLYNQEPAVDPGGSRHWFAPHLGHISGRSTNISEQECDMGYMTAIIIHTLIAFPYIR